MVDKLIDVSDNFDNSQKQIRLNAISGDADSAHAVAVNVAAGTITANLGTTDNAVIDDIAENQTDGTQKANIYDTQMAKTAKIDPMRELSTTQPERLVGTAFSGTTKDANFWTEGTNGTAATVTQANQAILQCGTDAAGYAVLSSNRVSRYAAGAANFFRAVVQMPVAGLANHISRWGAFTVSTRVPQDGYFFETSGTTLYLNYVNTNSTNPPVANRIASSSWTTPFTLDTNVHTYEIVWTNSSIWFYVDDVLRHKITWQTAPMVGTNNLPVNLQNISVTSTTNFILNVRVASIYRFGNFSTAPTYYHITGALTAQVLKRGAGVLHRVTINNPAAQAITLYDAVTAANAIAVISPIANSSPSTIEFGVPFNNGLAVTVAGTIDATVIYE